MSNEGPLSQLLRNLGLDHELAPIEAVKRITETPVAINHELFYSTRMRREMQYDRVPVGHDIGYRCYNGRKHDADSAYESGEYGDGLTEDQAYVAWLQAVDEPKPRAGRVVHSSPYEPPTIVDDDVTFDDDLE